MSIVAPTTYAELKSQLTTFPAGNAFTNGLIVTGNDALTTTNGWTIGGTTPQCLRLAYLNQLTVPTTISVQVFSVIPPVPANRITPTAVSPSSALSAIATNYLDTVSTITDTSTVVGTTLSLDSLTAPSTTLTQMNTTITVTLAVGQIWYGLIYFSGTAGSSGTNLYDMCVKVTANPSPITNTNTTTGAMYALIVFLCILGVMLLGIFIHGAMSLPSKKATKDVTAVGNGNSNNKSNRRSNNGTT